MTSDYQFTFNGVTFGAGTNIQLVRATGLEDLPAVSTNDVARPRDTGEFVGLDFAGGRDVVLDLLITDTVGAADFFTTVQAMATATVPILNGTSPLTFQVPGRINRQVNARPRRRSLPVDVDYQYRFGQMSVEFHCPDPRIYDANLTSLTLSPPSSTGGLSWPLAWPLSWGTATGNTVLCTNAGNVNTRPVLTFNGPMTSPSVVNLTTGQTWTSTAVLNTGDVLVADFDAHTLVLNGTASRYSTLQAGSVWWELAPGNTTIALSVDTGSGSAQIAFRSAWM